MVETKHRISRKALKNLIAKCFADIDGIHFEFVVAAELAKPVGCAPVASPCVGLAVDGRGREAGLSGIHGKGSANLGRRHLILTVECDNTLEGKVLGQLHAVVKSEVDALIAVVTPLEV